MGRWGGGEVGRWGGGEVGRRGIEGWGQAYLKFIHKMDIDALGSVNLK